MTPPAEISSPAVCLRRLAWFFLNGPAAVDCTATPLWRPAGGDDLPCVASQRPLVALYYGETQTDLDMVCMDEAMSGDRYDSGGAEAAETPGFVLMAPGQSMDSSSHPSPPRSEVELQNTEPPGSPVMEEPITIAASPVPPRGGVERYLCPRPQATTRLQGFLPK
ncbi:hypothetical protein NDU88_001146 [Pleurodeles waltl]|uniref:Uncharacterized protein n=1 Tax=Pleurodeles waltl TaxID=8319 RepID=A0AAV7U622_PLEWA|nr:hypothetical protein NDU88_001146 [Pleurodeles waltl]